MKPEGRGTLISSISRTISTLENLAGLYALLLIIITILGIVTLPMVSYEEDQLYTKSINR